MLTCGLKHEFTTLCDAYARSGFDFCATYLRLSKMRHLYDLDVSRHGFQYSMGVSDAYKLHTLRKWESFDAISHKTGRRKHADPQSRKAWIGGTAYNYGIGEAHYPVPALRRDIVYWNCDGISINTVGECEPSLVYGRCFGNGVRLNYWEP